MWVDGRSLASHCTVAGPSQLCNRFLAMQVVPVYILTFAFSSLIRFSIFAILSEIKIQNSAIVQLPTDTAV